MSQAESESTTHTIRPGYDIVASKLDQFRDEVQAVIDDGAVEMVIDLGEVTMIDSRGLAVFAVCQKALADRGGKLTVRQANPDLVRLFAMTRLDQHFEVQPA